MSQEEACSKTTPEKSLLKYILMSLTCVIYKCIAYWRSSSRIRKKFSLDETGDALDYQRNVHPRGKVVSAM
jgi:hypothetical protein